MITLPFGVGGRRRRARQEKKMPTPPPGSRPLPVPPGHREMLEEVLLKLYALGTVMTWQAIADEIGVNYVTIWRYRGGKAGQGPLSMPDNRAQKAILRLYSQSVLAGRKPRDVLRAAGVKLPPRMVS